MHPPRLHLTFYADKRFSYEIPITPPFCSSRFFMAVSPFVGCCRISFKKRFTLDGCHDIRSEPRGTPARAATRASSRPYDHAPINGRRDRASVPAPAGSAGGREDNGHSFD